MFLEPLLKRTAGAEGALASSRSGFPSDLAEPRAASRAARSRRGDWRRELPPERAIANARPAGDVRGGIAWEELQERQGGAGWRQPPDARIPAEPRLSLHPWFARELRPSLPSGRESSGSWRSRRCAPSRNSFPPEAKNARDRPRGFPDRDILRRLQNRAKANLKSPAKNSRHADGERALCQNSDRVRQAPWATPWLERYIAAFLHFVLHWAVTTSAFRPQGPGILRGAAICPNRWEFLPRCIRNREQFRHR